jgi:hypothetical protein
MTDLLSSRPDLAEGWAAMQAAVVETGLDPDLIAWSDARIRQMLGVPVDSGVDAPEPAVADFVEMYFMDVHAVTDEQASAATAALGDALFVALVVSLGMTEARARMELMLR